MNVSKLIDEINLATDGSRNTSGRNVILPVLSSNEALAIFAGAFYSLF